jgi:tetratricopeptide (TPR) repeat protein
MPLYRDQRSPDKLYVLAKLPSGREGAFLVDTGSSLTTVSEAVAQELGLEVRRRSGRLIGLGGSTLWRGATLSSLKIGGFTLRDVDVAVGVTGIPTHIGLVPLAGIIGNNIWSSFQVAIDYPGNTLTLSRGSMSLPATAEPMFFNGQHPMTRARIRTEGEAPPHPLLLEIDTGARGLLLMGQPPAHIADQASVGEEPILGIGSPDNLPPSRLLRETRRIPLKSVQAGGITVERALSATWIQGGTGRDEAGVRFTGLLGHEVFEGHKIYLDYLGRQFAVQVSTTQPTPRPIHEWYLGQVKRSADPDRHLKAIRIQLWLGHDDEARADLKRLVARKQPDPDAVVLMARLRRRDGDPEAAQSMLDGLEITDLVNAGEFNAWVNTLWLTGRLADALDATKRAIELAPDNGRTWVARADALMASGRFSDARSALHRANQIQENPDGHLLRRAWLAVEDGDRNAALTHLRRLLELFPSGGIVHLLYAQQAQDPRSLELVRQDLLRAQSRLHTGDGPLDFMAASWRIVGDPERAEKLMRAGLERDCTQASSIHSRDNCEAWYRALVHEELDDARVRIDRALLTAPSRAEFLDTLAMVLEAQGHAAAAGEAALKAARLAPDDIYLLVQAARLAPRQANP